jgi:hypothetical protein
VRAVKLTSHFHLVSRLRMSGSVPPFPYSPNAIKFYTRSNLFFTFLFYCCCRSINSEPSSFSRSQWPRGLRRGFAASCWPGLGVQIPSEAWMSLSYGCCALSGRGLIQRSPTDCGVPECDREASIMRLWSTGRCAMEGGLTHLDLSLDSLIFGTVL